MAKQLTSYSPSDGEFHPGRPPTYPWDEWLNGRIWALTYKKDFHCKIESMIANIYEASKVRGYDVSVFRRDATTLIIKPREDV